MLERGDFPIKDRALSPISSLALLEINEEVVEPVEVYIAHKIMPADPVGGCATPGYCIGVQMRLSSDLEL